MAIPEVILTALNNKPSKKEKDIGNAFSKAITTGAQSPHTVDDNIRGYHLLTTAAKLYGEEYPSNIHPVELAVAEYVAQPTAEPIPNTEGSVETLKGRYLNAIAWIGRNEDINYQLFEKLKDQIQKCNNGQIDVFKLYVYVIVLSKIQNIKTAFENIDSVIESLNQLPLICDPNFSEHHVADGKPETVNRMFKDLADRIAKTLGVENTYSEATAGPMSTSRQRSKTAGAGRRFSKGKGEPARRQTAPSASKQESGAAAAAPKSGFFATRREARKAAKAAAADYKKAAAAVTADESGTDDDLLSFGGSSAPSSPTRPTQ